MVAALSLTLATACVGTAPKPAATQSLMVTNGDRPFAMWEGAPARTRAEAECASRGQRLRTSIYDRFEAGAWVYPEGCA
ncbi:MAG: hypothetical protein HC844_11690 [Tabrizicola sp.]|nr:hypothetical protein [Tabrizicola sp.]